MRLLFIDVEATGIEDEDRLLQVAYRVGGKDVNELFKPSVPIKLPAMAVHHITYQMLEDKPSFAGSPTKECLKNLLNDGAVFVAHNAKYDLEMFTKEGLFFPNFICTLKIARYIDSGDKFENHQLQYLRYYYGINVEAVAHDAFGDIIVLEQVFRELYREFMQFEYGPGYEDSDSNIVIKRMMEISGQPTLLKAPFSFGKYAGKSLAEVKLIDRGYLEWLLKSKLEKPVGEEDWIFSLQTHLKS